MKKMKSTKGITLIALVVTVIVLLILAGVTISLVTADNGLLNNARTSKKDTDRAKAIEEMKIAILDVQTKNDGDISEERLVDIFKGKIHEEDEEEKNDITYKDGERYSIKDKKGNYEILISEVWNGVATPREFTTVANAPDLNGFDKANTYYVSWGDELKDGEYPINEETPIGGLPPANWYDYTDGKEMWANIKTTGGGNACYWVWIPRYAYKMPSSEGTIGIEFLEGTSNRAISGNSLDSTWKVHPAFTNEGNGGFGDLTGIWVAKFEASSNYEGIKEIKSEADIKANPYNTAYEVRVQPNVRSWNFLNVNNMLKVCQNLTTSDNSLVNSEGIDSHLMKNTEWGAAAYLSRSVYGGNKAVSSNSFKLEYEYEFDNSKTDFVTVTGLYGSSLANRYNTANGVNASTTGNVYGVYDMVGGLWDAVAATLSGYENNGTYNISGYNYDSYGNSLNNSGVIGDAVYETSGWDSDLANYVKINTTYNNRKDTLFIRGHRAGVTNNADGIFAYNGFTGGAANMYGFRPCLVTGQ